MWAEQEERLQDTVRDIENKVLQWWRQYLFPMSLNFPPVSLSPSPFPSLPLLLPSPSLSFYSSSFPLPLPFSLSHSLSPFFPSLPLSLSLPLSSPQQSQWKQNAVYSILQVKALTTDLANAEESLLDKVGKIRHFCKILLIISYILGEGNRVAER